MIFLFVFVFFFCTSVFLCGQVVRGPQLIAVASTDPGATGVEASPLQGNDIQVQYVQLAPVTDHTAAVQVSNHGRDVNHRLHDIDIDVLRQRFNYV